MKNWNLKNIKEGPILTVLGICIIIASAVSVFVPSADVSWTEAAVGSGIGFFLLGLEDPKNKQGGALLMLGIILTALIVLSCREQPTHTNTETIVRYKDTSLYRGGDNVENDMDPDVIKALLITMQENGQKPEIVYKSDDKKINELVYRLDQFGKLVVACRSRDSLYQVRIRELEQRETKEVIKEIEVVPKWVKWSLIGLGITVILSLITNIIKR